MLDDIMDSMEFDKFKDKEAYNKDEFYVTLCTVAKRAKAFREMFMDRKPNFIKPIRPRVRKNLSTNKSISKINRNKSKITQLQTLESGINSGSGQFQLSTDRNSINPMKQNSSPKPTILPKLSNTLVNINQSTINEEIELLNNPSAEVGKRAQLNVSRELNISIEENH